MLRRVSLVSTNILLCLFILQLTSSATVDNTPNQEEVYEAINTAPANNERWVTKGPREARISYSDQGSDINLPANSRLAQFFNAQPSTKVPIRPERTWVQPNIAGLQGILPKRQKMSNSRQKNNHILQRSQTLSPEAVRGISRQQGKSRLEQLLSPDVVRGNSPEQGNARLQQWAQLSPEKIRGFTRQQGNAKLQRLNQLSSEVIRGHFPERATPRLTRLNQLSPEVIREHLPERATPRLTRVNQFLPEATEHLPIQREDEQEEQYYDAIDISPEEQLGQPMPRDKFPPYQQASQFQHEDQFHDAIDSSEHENVESIDEFQTTTYPQQTYVDPQQADIQLPRPNADPLPPPAFVDPSPPQPAYEDLSPQQPAYEEPSPPPPAKVEPPSPPPYVEPSPPPPAKVEPPPPPTYVDPSPPPPAKVELPPPPTYVDPPPPPPAKVEPPLPYLEPPTPLAYEEPALNPATQRKPVFWLPQREPYRNPEPQLVAPNVDQGYQPFQPPVSGWDSWHTQPARATLSYDDQSTYDYQQPNSYLAEYPATVGGDQGLLPRSPPTYEQPASGLDYVTYDVTPQSPVTDLPIDVYNRAVRAYLDTKTPIAVSRDTLIPLAYSDIDYQDAFAFAENYVAQYKAALGIR